MMIRRGSAKARAKKKVRARAAAPKPSISPRATPASNHRRRVLLVLSYYDYRHHAGVARYAAQRGWRLEESFTLVRALPESWSGDGIISFHGPDARFIEWLGKAGRGVPIVDIGEYEEFSDYPRVMPDADAIAEMAVRYFMARGYRRLGFAWRFENAFKRKRLEAARAACAGRGIEFVDVPIDQISALAARGALPIALLAANDGTAVQTLRACEDAGLRVPEQAAVLGVDNFEYRCVPNHLSSIDARQEQIGYEAAALLDRLMSGQRVAPRHTVRIAPAAVIERDSTNMLAVDDLEVALALRFVIQNFSRPIGLRDVAKSTSLSLRRLQTRFKDAIGRTILQEINTRRVNYAQKLLAEGNQKIHAVAKEAGFGGSVKMIRVFQQYVGTSPKRYRKKVKQGRRNEK